MKRITCIFLVLCLCVNVTGCGSSGEQGENTKTSDSAVSADAALKQASKILKKMTLEEKIGQLILVDLDRLTESEEAVTQCSEEILEAIDQYKIGGVVLGKQNIKNTSQTKELIQNLSEQTGTGIGQHIPLYIGTEEQGGGDRSIAADCDDMNSTGYTSPSEMGENMTEGQLEDTGGVIASELTELGFNLNLAPPADIAQTEKTVDSETLEWEVLLANESVLGKKPEYKAPKKKISKKKQKKRMASYEKKVEAYRAKCTEFLEQYKETDYAKSCFGSEADQVSEAVSAMVKGMHSVKAEDGQTMATVLTTFPGISSVAAYHKLDVLDIDTALSILRKENFKPFSAGIEAGTDFIMVGHVSLSKIDGSTPASFSRVILKDLLRKEMGFTGIILTEQLDVPAVTDEYSTKEAVIKAIASGADMIYDPADLDEAVSAIEQAVMFREIDEKVIDQAVLRVLQNKIQRNILTTASDSQ